jgi:small-conductance mechanosensitive channel
MLLRFWIEDPTNGVTNIKGNVLLGLWEAFKEKRIEIPFPRREVIIRDLSRSALSSARDAQTAHD